MCIIIDNREGKAVPKDIAERCVSINKDGFGFVDLDTGQLTRTMDMEVAKEMILQERPYIAHCRYTTIGGTNLDNVHPFRTSDGSLLFQNGTIDGFTNWKQSDTRQMAELLQYVKPCSVKAFLESFDSRFLIVHNDFSVLRTGKWHERDGIWYSKDNVFPGKKKKWVYGNHNGYQEFGYYNGRTWTSGSAVTSTPAAKAKPLSVERKKNHALIGVYGTLRHGYGNHMHYLADADLIGEGITHNRYRLCVNGLPYLIRGAHQAGKHVELEVYSVTRQELQQIDLLEGHPSFYQREKILIELYGGEKVWCWVYMVDESHDNGVYYESYNDAKLDSYYWDGPVDNDDDDEEDLVVGVDAVHQADGDNDDDDDDSVNWYDNLKVRGFHV